MPPKFGQSAVTLGCDTRHCCLKARLESSSGFLSPPAPRGSPDRASEFRVRFNPQYFTGRLHVGPFFFAAELGKILADGRHRDPEHDAGRSRHAALHDDGE